MIKKPTMVLQLTQPVSMQTIEHVMGSLAKVEERTGIQFVILDEGLKVVALPEGIYSAQVTEESINRLSKAFTKLRRIWGDGKLLWEEGKQPVRYAPSYFDWAAERKQ